MQTNVFKQNFYYLKKMKNKKFFEILILKFKIIKFNVKNQIIKKLIFTFKKKFNKLFFFKNKLKDLQKNKNFI